MGYGSWRIIKIGNSLAGIGAVMLWFLFVFHFRSPNNYILMLLDLFSRDLTCFGAALVCRTMSSIYS